MHGFAYFIAILCLFFGMVCHSCQFIERQKMPLKSIIAEKLNKIWKIMAVELDGVVDSIHIFFDFFNFFLSFGKAPAINLE